MSSPVDWGLAETTAVAVAEQLAAHGLLASVAASSGAIAADCVMLATDGRERFARVGSGFLGMPLSAEGVELVDL